MITNEIHLHCSSYWLVHFMLKVLSEISFIDSHEVILCKFEKCKINLYFRWDTKYGTTLGKIFQSSLFDCLDIFA